MRQMAELQQFQRKVIDLEFKVKTLETSLTEKNAMVSTVPIKQCCGSMQFLVWIRIRGSKPLTNGSGSSYFRH
jgi:hypothetical protein